MGEGIKVECGLMWDEVKKRKVYVIWVYFFKNGFLEVLFNSFYMGVFRLFVVFKRGLGI